MARDSRIEGRKIVQVRPMTVQEMEAEGWDAEQESAPSVMVLDNGTILFASSDEEGNGSGSIFGTQVNGEQFQIN